MDRWEELRQLLGWEVVPLTEDDLRLNLSVDEGKAIYAWLRRQEKDGDKASAANRAAAVRVKALVEAVKAYKQARDEFDEYGMAVEQGDEGFDLVTKIALNDAIDKTRDGLFTALAPPATQE